uniref:Glycolipid transfer protein domain-containing protein n=1 Tax=Haptolina brevifila TaxID=156173 RepID=A0A7S2CG42_9EUKA|mmetsp:Transcript_2373/g.4886  ORF Transcript_2373/g.4886 Transcript_2373/m.4886 type:complete len:207 (+) Transcript_2373:71-691(+)|eukprot:CAMPEP_0174725374 /NCGR_PEP_ID=MMETSP1094-20130205/45402_1 /TAXON_ID=156173 /ORGANISM="Chrysochromulina brevifilum, Strain UTEX LB 985" /LENGTH=206 /DNA_ID=CAMNT_0015926761 /DNA_START=69 /DNA_END=689 /DNA_ORIENTATION=+
MGDWLESSKVLEKFQPLMEKGMKAEAAAFADASLALISVFDLIPGMGMASGDMVKNAKTVQDLAKDGTVTLEALVESETAGCDAKKLKKIADDGKTASCALLWLARALNFIIVLMDTLMKESTKKLSDCVLAGYEVSLKPHHGMIIRGTFSVAVKAAPNREDFIKKLGPSEAEVFGKLEPEWPKLTALVTEIRAFLKAKDASAFKD